MKHLKRFTKSITLILEFCIGLGFIFLIAQLMKITGFLDLLDSLYFVSIIAFWAAAIVTRLLFMLSFFKIFSFIEQKGEELGFFWIDHDLQDNKADISKKDEDVDRSEDIIRYVTLSTLFIFILEILLRLATSTMPPFLR